MDRADAEELARVTGVAPDDVEEFVRLMVLAPDPDVERRAVERAKKAVEEATAAYVARAAERRAAGEREWRNARARELRAQRSSGGRPTAPPSEGRRAKPKRTPWVDDLD